MWTQITCLANPNDEQGIPNPMRNTHGNTVNGGGGRRCRRHPSPCESQVRKCRVRPTHLRGIVAHREKLYRGSKRGARRCRPENNSQALYNIE